MCGYPVTDNKNKPISMRETIDSVIVKTTLSSLCSETKTKGIMIKFFVSQNQQSGLFKFNKNKNCYIDLY